MIRITPTERLEWLLKRPELARAHSAISNLLQHYERFLETTSVSENELDDITTSASQGAE